MSNIFAVNVPGGMRVEQTGGGCTALTATLPGGLVLVLSDGNHGHDLGRSGGAASAALFEQEAWEDGGDPISEWSAYDTVGVVEVIRPTEVLIDTHLRKITDVVWETTPLPCDECGAGSGEPCFPDCTAASEHGAL